MIVYRLHTAREIGDFSAGKTVREVTASEEGGHTRFAYTDGTALLVMFYAGQVWSEHTEEPAEISYYAEVPGGY